MQDGCSSSPAVPQGMDLLGDHLGQVKALCTTTDEYPSVALS